MNDLNGNSSINCRLSLSENSSPMTGLTGVSDVTVIIRTVGERTLPTCFKLLSCQVPSEHIHIVQETPQLASLKASFRLGYEEGRKWTLCVDADTLMCSGSVKHLVRLGEAAEENICVLQGQILDKFFNHARQAGHWLYRTALLPNLISQIPAEGTDIRIESHAVSRMSDRGYPKVECDYIVGLHDYEQFYRDIFRKGYQQAHKHSYLLPEFLSYWRKQADIDPDFKFALWGLAAGVATSNGVVIDTKRTPFDILDFFANGSWSEKEALYPAEWEIEQVDAVIASYLRKLEEEQERVDRGRLSTLAKFRDVYNKLGAIRLLPYMGGWLIYKSGKQIMDWLD